MQVSKAQGDDADVIAATVEIALQNRHDQARVAVEQAGVVTQAPSRLQTIAVHEQ